MFNISCVERMVITIITEQKPKEIILRSRNKNYINNPKSSDSIIDPNYAEKFYSGLSLSDIDSQKFYDLCQSHETKNTAHTHEKMYPSQKE